MPLDYEGTKKHLGLETDSVTDESAHFLETRGYQFCVDFGIRNARSMAQQILEGEWDELLLRGDRLQ